MPKTVDESKIDLLRRIADALDKLVELKDKELKLG